MNFLKSPVPTSGAVSALPRDLQTKTDATLDLDAAVLRVLLVEDRQDQQEDALKLLFQWGITPAIASNGVKAVKLCREQAFDVILMDIAMPIMDGLEATMLIRRDELACTEPRHCPIIAYTSGGTTDDKMLWGKIGVDDVLIKPTQPEQMAACLTRWCGSRLRASRL